MIGAIIGDIIGSVYEFGNIKTVVFPLFSEGSEFTDDTVLTIATADCILNNKDYAETYKAYGRKYPDAGYGGVFYQWIFSEDWGPYNSFGNGSAMRVSPVGFAFSTLEEVLSEAKKSAEVTHSHPEGIKGAQATAAAIFLARNGASKEEIKEYIERTFDYNLHRRLDAIRPFYEFDVTCQGSVPEAIMAFLESFDFESTIRLAVSLGGDSDTIACIAGGIAQAFYKEIHHSITKKLSKYLPEEFMKVIDEFNRRFNIIV
jgi:ADP-ribosylglycohydrolase